MKIKIMTIVLSLVCSFNIHAMQEQAPSLKTIDDLPKFCVYIAKHWTEESITQQIDINKAYLIMELCEMSAEASWLHKVTQTENFGHLDAAQTKNTINIERLKKSLDAYITLLKNGLQLESNCTFKFKIIDIPTACRDKFVHLLKLLFSHYMGYDGDVRYFPHVHSAMVGNYVRILLPGNKQKAIFQKKFNISS